MWLYVAHLSCGSRFPWLVLLVLWYESSYRLRVLGLRLALWDNLKNLIRVWQWGMPVVTWGSHGGLEWHVWQALKLSLGSAHGRK